MSIGRLVASLATLPEPPVDVDEIVAWMKSEGYVKEVYFRATSKFTKLAGAYECNGTSPNNYIVDVWYGAGLQIHGVNFTCCKELLHVFDNDSEAVNNREAASALIANICSFADTKDFVAIFDRVGNDFANVLMALVVLAPIHLVEPYEVPRHEGKIPDSKLADIFMIPEDLVPFIFSSIFKSVYYKIIQSEKNA